MKKGFSKEVRFALFFLIFFGALHFGYNSMRGSKLEKFAVDIVTVTPGAWLINTLSPDERVTASGKKLVSPHGTLTILNGCEGFESIFLLLAAIAAFSSSWLNKLSGFLIGIGMVYILNQARIVILFFCFRYRKDWFDPIHSHIAPTLIILIASLFFLGWVTIINNKANSKAPKEPAE